VLLQVLGYDNHAAYVLETRMAKSPANVLKFLSDLETKLGPGAAKGPRAGFERRVSSFCLLVHVILAVCPVCIPLWLTCLFSVSDASVEPLMRILDPCARLLFCGHALSVDAELSSLIAMKRDVTGASDVQFGYWDFRCEDAAEG
jgi:hypothetical protein